MLYLSQYLMILPSIYNMCVEATVTRSLSGCQLLTFIGHYQSGIPAVAEAIERFVMYYFISVSIAVTYCCLILFRILSRVQSVMYRQTMAWILYGRLDDSAGEFFVKYRDTDASQTVGIRHQSWNRSFTLKLDCIPESHLSAVQASKILFAGKTACLLNQTLFATSKSLPGKSNTGIRSKRHSNEVYQYLCSNHFEGNQKSHTSFANAESISPRSFPPETHNHTQSKNNLDHSSSGLVPSFLAEKDLISFAQSFQQILHSSAASSVVLFNDLGNDNIKLIIIEYLSFRHYNYYYYNCVSSRPDTS